MRSEYDGTGGAIGQVLDRIGLRFEQVALARVPRRYWALPCGVAAADVTARPCRGAKVRKVARHPP